ncbi:MAG: leucine-rich repeat protein [Bacteroidales bacterium]|nr:leucine-rich repeat protein [Bacteroidales bacterium]
MKNLYTIIFCLVLSSTLVCAQDSISINVLTAGQMKAAIETAGGKDSTIKKLTITGTIDARDFVFLRDSMPLLSAVYMESAQIAAYSGSNGTSSLVTDFSANEIPSFAFCSYPAFLGKTSLTIIKLPEGIASIGAAAFYYCSGLSGISFPNSVETIMNGAFTYCTGLTGNLTLPSSLIRIYESAFFGCSGLSGNLVIPDKVTSIETAAFKNCTGLTGNLTLPNLLTSIGSSAFYECKFTGQLTLPAALTTLGYSAFEGCNGFTGSLAIPNGLTAIGSWTFGECSGLSDTLYIPNSINTIENNAFDNCNGLKKIKVGRTQPPVISYSTFQNINKTTCKLGIPIGATAAYQADAKWNDFTDITEDVAEVKFNTQYAQRLKDTLVLPNTYIVAPAMHARLGYTFGGWYKESSCINIWTFGTDKVVTSMTLYAQWTFDGYTEVEVPEAGGLSLALITAGANKNTLNNLKISGKLDARDFMFMRDSMPVLANVDMAAVQIMAYSQGSGYLDKQYPANELPQSAFIYKHELTHVVLPESITSIGQDAFVACTGLTGTLAIPSAVTSIGAYAFDGCSGFTGNLTIPSSVKTIENRAFSFCTGLNGSLQFQPNSNLTSIKGDAFWGCTNLSGNLTIPNSVTTIENGAFKDCENLYGSLNLPSSLTSIGSEAFFNCKGLSGNIVIPGAVTTIGGNAFYGCSGFQDSLYLPSSLTSIGGNVFNQSNLKKIIVSKVAPVNLATDPFSGINKATCILLVPRGSVGAYKASNYWKDFNVLDSAIFVNFDSRGGNQIADTTVSSGATIPAPKAPVKSNNTFGGWYKEASCTNAWNFGSDAFTTSTILLQNGHVSISLLVSIRRVAPVFQARKWPIIQRLQHLSSQEKPATFLKVGTKTSV